MKIIRIISNSFCLLHFFIAFLFIFFFSNINSFANDSLYLEKDFINNLIENHPEFKQYQLQLKQADAGILKYKGAFDPVIFSNYQQKSFNGKEYYSILNSGIQYPTALGFDIISSYDLSRGYYLNPQNTLPEQGLFSLGINISLLNGLFFDSRRANLRQAINNANSIETQQLINLNDFFYNALKAYWNWVEAYNKYNLIKINYENVNERFKNIKSTFLLGDIPAIDTLETYIMLNERALLLQQSQNEEFVARANLKSFIWENQNIPINNLNIKAIDYTLHNFSIHNILDTNEISYSEIPQINLIKLTKNEYEIERLLKLEKFKPKLDLKYNFISENLGGNTFDQFNPNNYSLGVKFEFPLLVREARGDVELSDIKIEQIELKLAQKIFEYENKLKANFSEFNLLFEQIKVINEMALNYETLLLAELNKFENGESSVFLVNNRELKSIEFKIKQIQTKCKTILSYYKYLQTQGRLVEYFTN